MIFKMGNGSECDFSEIKGTLTQGWWEFKLVQPFEETVWKFFKKFKK